MTDNHDRSAKFLSLAVHEFRTPLSVVSGSLRMLQRHFGESLTPQQRSLVELAETSCGSLSSLVSELSELSELSGRAAPIRRDPVRLIPLLSDLAKDVHEGEDRGCTFGVRAGDPDVEVAGNATRLRAAFATVVAAVLRERADAAPMLAACRVVETPGGRIVKTAIAEASAVDSVLSEDAHEAFDEYRGGMGFRLLLASRIVEAHGGRIVSPVSARGRLAIVVSLPVVPDAESIG